MLKFWVLELSWDHVLRTVYYGVWLIQPAAY